MEPILPRDTEPEPRLTLQGYTKLLWMYSFLWALIFLLLSLGFFVGFLETDQNSGSIISSFLFCFGIGGLGYIPAAVMGGIVFKAYHLTYPRYIALLGLCLYIPIILLAGGLLYPGGHIIWACLIFIYGFPMILWSFKLLTKPALFTQTMK